MSEQDLTGAAGPEFGVSPGADPGAPTLDDLPPPRSRRSPIRTMLGLVMAWVLPGLGHVFLGRLHRGIVMAAVVLGLFVGGIALEGKVYRPIEGEPLTYLAALGAAGVGIPFALAHFTGLAGGNLEGRYFEYGNTFTLVAGLLNLLVVLDAFDVATGRRP